MSQVYKLKATVSTTGGSGSQNTNRVVHGLCYQLFVNAGTSTTIFRANLTDEDGDVIKDYDFHRGQINDLFRDPVPVVGVYTINVTNASADGDFTCKFLVVE